MNFLKNIKNDNGVTMIDIVIGVLIIIIFVTILTTSFYRIYKHNASQRIDASVVDCCVKICEYVDEIMYNDVSNDLNSTIKQTLQQKYEDYTIPDNYNITIDVQNYNSIDPTKEDIIKIVNVKIQYESIDETKEYTIKNLRITPTWIN